MMAITKHECYRALIRHYKKKFEVLESHIKTLEASEAVLKTVTENLKNELDSLDQYGRRSNILIRNVEINERDATS